MMNTGAVIVASCMSQKTNRFRPVLQMGGQSMIKKAVRALRAANVSPIVVVTGVHAEQIRSELEGEDVLLLHNPDHMDGDMLESAKLGIRQCLESCERIFVTPVCIPPFTASTVRQLMERQEAVCIPVRMGLGGHPVLLGAEVAEKLLLYTGPDGIRGGLRWLDVPICRVAVTEDGPSRERRFHESVQVRLVNETPFFGPGPQQLLLGIQSRGSVSGACEAIGMSYSKGRGIIRTMERALGFSLVDRVQGGANGGSARLTAKGELFLEIFARYEQSVADYASEIFDDYFGELEERKDAVGSN